MADKKGFAAQMGDIERGNFSLEDVDKFLRDTLERFPDLKPEGIRASLSLIKKGLGETYLDLPVSPQPDWYPGEVVELQFQPA